ncbi:hypothetical protein F4677DRAFT_417475 [Hypoxylon crocopeplum]|nr:hypothetical protein F4677DRAFT_417475 [Hypoxylon crocopeplum]
MTSHAGSLITPDECDLDRNLSRAAILNWMTKTEHSGLYIDRFDVGDPSVHALKPWVTSHADAERLWKLSEQLVKQTFSY